MDIITLLTDYAHGKREQIEQARIVEFSGKQYPLLFFSLFLRVFKQHSSSPIEVIDLDDVDETVVHSKLATSFLGMRSCYWLRSISDLDKKKLHRWTVYVQEYSGLNTIFFFVEGDSIVKDGDGVVRVTIPDAVDAKDCLALMRAFGYQLSPAIQKFVGDLYKKTGQLSLDDSCLMMRYALLVGAGAPDFLEHWLDHVVISQQSLFTLSQYFFAKNSRAFFTLWHKIGPQYGEMFWVAFWSEQLWRAYQYVRFLEQGNRTEARTIGYRLPFSFLQRDWQDVHEAELKHAHQFIYSTDYWLKNGGNATLLEVMYLNFFTGNFQTDQSVRALQHGA